MKELCCGVKKYDKHEFDRILKEVVIKQPMGYFKNLLINYIFYHCKLKSTTLFKGWRKCVSSGYLLILNLEVTLLMSLI